jgi:glycosyltransferase involved in cell wall biosynthesis
MSAVTMQVSVIICTHNPREDYLRRVLEALKAQTLPKEQWELLLIDNASKEPLASAWDLSWHPLARHVREDEVGLTPARLRGIRETKGEILVFVDDDNVLERNYLENAAQTGKAWPILGAWGGSIVPEFESSPPPWAKPYLRYLAIREVKQDQWSNYSDNPGRMPWGAGMCVRHTVAEEYARRLASDSIRYSLDRRGRSLASFGDSDLAMTACDLGLGTGLFSSLRLNHLIRAERVTESYLLNLMEGMVYSLKVGGAIRGKFPERISWPRFLWGHLTALRRGFHEFRFYRASLRGARAAAKEIAFWQTDSMTPRICRR